MNALICVILLGLVGASLQDSVSTSAACNRQSIGKNYPQGCSGLTAELLGKPWEAAEQYRLGDSIGSNNNYHGVSPGDLVGFRGPPAHVAVYVGGQGCDCKFVDVPGPGKNARCVRNGYGSTEVFKADY